MAKTSVTQTPLRFLPLALCVVVFVYLVLKLSVTLSALADHESIGRQFRAAVEKDAAMARVYIATGDVLRGILPTVGTEAASQIAAPLVTPITGYPPSAVAVVFGDARSTAQSSMQWQFRLAPFMLFLSLFAWWRLPKNVHMVRQTRQR